MEHYEDISVILHNLKKEAQQGFDLSTKAITSTEKSIKILFEKLDNSLEELFGNKFYDQNIENELKKQLKSIKNELDNTTQQLKKNNNRLSKEEFSITLFGRTMAGKSTLMEILTNGNGSSIGKGAQRTTRDVRSYYYQGLKVTDVPGVAAFEGKSDESLAFEEAKKSDLVIFLITDDAPQESELSCLREIYNLGKPVICLMNVKASLNLPSDFKMFKRDILKKYKGDRINEIMNQLYQYGEAYGQNWRRMEFVYTHLRAAYLSQKEEFHNIKDELFELSQFNKVNEKIIKEIKKKGAFYKFKAFIDSYSSPMTKVIDTLFTQSVINSKNGSIIIKKRKELLEWSDSYKEMSKSKIDDFIRSVSCELRDEVASFAEYNYDNENANEKWKRVIEQYKINEKAEKLIKNISYELEKKIKEISRELEFDMNHSFSDLNSFNIKGKNIFDSKRAWNWGTTILSSGVLAASLFFTIPGAGWIAAGIGVIGWLFSFFFDDKEKKIADARRKMERNLNKQIDSMMYKLEKNLNNVFYKNIINEQLYKTTDSMSNVVSIVYALSDMQQEFAKRANDNMESLNMELLKKGFECIGAQGLEYHILKNARIPGYSFMWLINKGTIFPKDIIKDLRRLLNEGVIYVTDNDKINVLFKNAVGCNLSYNDINIQNIKGVPRIVHINNIDSLSATEMNRIKLAQQLTGLLVTE